MVGLSFVTSLIADLHDVPPSGRASVLSRLRRLSLEDFPPGHRVGSANSADYSLDDMVALSAWFSLSEAFVPPVIATRMLRSCWPEIARGHAVAFARAPDGSPTFAVFSPAALADMGREERAKGRGGINQGTWELSMASGAEALAALPAARGGLIVLDLGRIAERLMALLGASLDSPSLRSAVDDFVSREAVAEDLAGSDVRIVPTEHAHVTPAAGDRLVVGDHLYARAIEVVRPVVGGAVADPPRRLIDYVARPNRREGWKRWVEVEGSGVPFLWAFSTWLEASGRDGVVVLPETLKTAIEGRLSKGDAVADIGRALIATAERAKLYEPSAPSGRPVELALLPAGTD